MNFFGKNKKQNLLILLGYAVVAILLVKACKEDEIQIHQKTSTADDSITRHAAFVDSLLLRERAPIILVDSNGKPVKNRITSVRRFETSFPDLNDIQLATAQKTGVSAIRDREEATKKNDKLVYIGENPYYYVRPLSHSIPYLTPHAATLLNTIARAFVDSLATKGLPFHKIEVTSVLRTQKDIEKLGRVNVNASKNSCHQFGTTFDIGYNQFERIQPSPEDTLEMSDGVKLKSILAEVLEDQRLLGTCYVKYERKQACFHITAR